MEFLENGTRFRVMLVVLLFIKCLLTAKTLSKKWGIVFHRKSSENGHFKNTVIQIHIRTLN